MDRYLLSIIIPVYNAEKTIGRTLDSLQRISLESKEPTQILIIDDGSQDKSRQIIEEKKQDLLPLEIVILNQKNQGSGAARNAGLQKSRGEWIFFLDADDEIAFDPIPFLMESGNASALAFTVLLYKNSERRGKVKPSRINIKNHLTVFTARNACTASSIIFKKEYIQCLFDADVLYLEDWLFWMMNPLVFKQMKIFPGQVSAIIHGHDRNKTADYGLNGKYRKIIAGKMIAGFGGRLDRKQRNNLLIQARIGMLQQGVKIPLNTFFLMPCTLSVYAKLMVYFLLRGKTAKLGLYGN